MKLIHMLRKHLHISTKTVIYGEMLALSLLCLSIFLYRTDSGQAVMSQAARLARTVNPLEDTNGPGSGQGSVISPLLANVALHGMEKALGIKYYVNKRSDGYTWAVNPTAYAMTRYADDFVVMCNTKQQAESVYNKLKPYLAQRGLELEETKTKIVEVTKGFDFLGFNIR